MESTKKIAVKFEVPRLTRDLGTVSELTWTPILEGGRIAWNGVALRSLDGLPTTMTYSDGFYRDTILLSNMAYIQKILGLFECPLQRVRFLALAPRAVIPEHTDCVPESGTPSIRLHIPIITNDKVSFLVQGEEVKMQSGELWYVDVALRHSVANYGDQARIHLVIDCQLNDWLIDLIHGDGARELHNALYSQHAAGV